MKCCACGKPTTGMYVLYVPAPRKGQKGLTKPICRKCRMGLSQPWQTQADVINRQNKTAKGGG